jgi:hypothetical protein
LVGREYRDRRMVGYRVPTELRTLTEEQKVVASKADFKRSSKDDFLVQYEVLQCGVLGLLFLS